MPKGICLNGPKDGDTLNHDNDIYTMNSGRYIWNGTAWQWAKFEPPIELRP